MKTRYPIKFGNKVYPAGTEVRQATLEEMRQVWPGIKPNASSTQLGVWFEGMDMPTIVHRTHILHGASAK